MYFHTEEYTRQPAWISPDHRTESQIDHIVLYCTVLYCIQFQNICIEQEFMIPMQDVRVQRRADATSDHHLLKKGEIKRSTRTRYNVDFLMDREVTETFRLKISNKYEALQYLLEEENMDIDTQWQHIKETSTSTCKEILGKKKC